MSRSTFCTVALLLAGLTGCASSARLVERNTTGGVVAVPDSKHRSDGLALIKKEAGPNAVVVEEGEVPTGTVTRSTADSGTGSVFSRMFSWFTGHQQTQTNVTTTGTATEWRMTYQLGLGVVPAQVQVPAAP